MGKHERNHLIFSPSGLGTFRDCLRCGFLEYHTRGMDACPRPKGIFPTLPNGVDKVIKLYHDGYREKRQLPPYLVGSVNGILYPDKAKIAKLRFWKTGPTTTIEHRGSKVSIRGALDDLILTDDDQVSMFDSKSKGFVPKDDGSQYYQTQLDCYDFMLGHNGYQTTGIGYLAYVWPELMKDNDNPLEPGMGIRFGGQTFALKTSAERAKTTILAAADVILDDVLPEPSPTCEHCLYVEARNSLEEKMQEKEMLEKVEIMDAVQLVREGSQV